MKQCKEKMGKKASKKLFYKTNPYGGISLIVLVITIIVVIILAAAVIISLQSNNPMVEANRARYESDVANMQMIFTNTVGKIMAEKQEVVGIRECQINQVTSGVKSATGEVIYTINNEDAGKIIFTNEKSEEANNYITGKKLPIYSSQTKWNVDNDGILRLQVGKEKYGEESETKNPATIGNVQMIYLGKFDSYVKNIIDVSMYEGYENFTVDNFVLGNVQMKAVRNTVVDDQCLKNLLDTSSYNPSTGKLTNTIVGDSTGVWMDYLIFDLYLILGEVERK